MRAFCPYILYKHTFKHKLNKNGLGCLVIWTRTKAWGGVWGGGARTPSSQCKFPPACTVSCYMYMW